MQIIGAGAGLRAAPPTLFDRRRAAAVPWYPSQVRDPDHTMSGCALCGPSPMGGWWGDALSKFDSWRTNKAAQLRDDPEFQLAPDVAALSPPEDDGIDWGKVLSHGAEYLTSVADRLFAMRAQREQRATMQAAARLASIELKTTYLPIAIAGVALVGVGLIKSRRR